MKNMSNKAKTGQDGELAAANYLLQNGYSVIEKNYRHKRSEIDIIAMKEKLLVFVEVKTKRNNAFGYPEEAVDNNKIKKVLEGADHYIHELNWCHNVRFDVIAIDHSTKEISHFKDAFY